MRHLRQLSGKSSAEHKHFVEEAFNDAVGVIPFHVVYVFEDINDIYWAHESLLKDALD